MREQAQKNFRWEHWVLEYYYDSVCTSIDLCYAHGVGKTFPVSQVSDNNPPCVFCYSHGDTSQLHQNHSTTLDSDLFIIIRLSYCLIETVVSCDRQLLQLWLFSYRIVKPVCLNMSIKYLKIPNVFWWHALWAWKNWVLHKAQ